MLENKMKYLTMAVNRTYMRSETLNTMHELKRYDHQDFFIN